MNITTAGPIPPEKAAYALARYSRSADSFADSLKWVKANNKDFLEKFYFQYGHASVADLGHLTMAFEGISDLAAIEIEDEPLWDGQAKSTRYQDFSQCQPVIPADLDEQLREGYLDTFERLLKAYREVHAKVRDSLMLKTPKPADMKSEAYDRTLNARAFDAARYLLPMGIPTNVGQVTSIRTLEKQARRLAASRYQELRDLATNIEAACARPPDVGYYDAVVEDYSQRGWLGAGQGREGLVPTLARHLEPSPFLEKRCSDLAGWYGTVRRAGCPGLEAEPCAENRVAVTRSCGDSREVLATLLYPYCQSSFESVLEFVNKLSNGQVNDGFEAALASRGEHDELPREFRNTPYAFDIVMDIGAYRDLHRHRRCHQFRQSYSTLHDYETPVSVMDAGCADIYTKAMEYAHQTHDLLWPVHGAAYILPFGTRIRCLFKMDFAELEYICKLRSGVKGHFSYRQIVWWMYQQFKSVEPRLAELMQVTPPWITDTLTR